MQCKKMNIKNLITSRTAVKLSTVKNYRLIIRNHWSDNFNDSFLFVLDKKWQGHSLIVYRIGLFNICLCLMVEK